MSFKNYSELTRKLHEAARSCIGVTRNCRGSTRSATSCACASAKVSLMNDVLNSDCVFISEVGTCAVDVYVYSDRKVEFDYVLVNVRLNTKSTLWCRIQSVSLCGATYINTKVAIKGLKSKGFSNLLNMSISVFSGSSEEKAKRTEKRK